MPEKTDIYKLKFNRLEIYGHTCFFSEQYKITSYVFKTTNTSWTSDTVPCKRYWVAYYSLPPYSWGNRVVNRDFDTPEEAMHACQLAWEVEGHKDHERNANGRKCYESLRKKHSYKNASVGL